MGQARTGDFYRQRKGKDHTPSPRATQNVFLGYFIDAPPGRFLPTIFILLIISKAPKTWGCVLPWDPPNSFL